MCGEGENTTFVGSAEFCTAEMPDSDEIEPAVQGTKGEASGAWKKSKTTGEGKGEGAIP